MFSVYSQRCSPKKEARNARHSNIYKTSIEIAIMDYFIKKYGDCVPSDPFNYTSGDNI